MLGCKYVRKKNKPEVKERNEEKIITNIRKTDSTFEVKKHKDGVCNLNDLFVIMINHSSHRNWRDTFLIDFEGQRFGYLKNSSSSDAYSAICNDTIIYCTQNEIVLVLDNEVRKINFLKSKMTNKSAVLFYNPELNTEEEYKLTFEGEELVSISSLKK